MREIKFRAWHTGRGMIEPPFNLHVKDHMTMLMREDGLFGYQGGSITLMQYTGLKDKNGVEIYEGDILAFWNESLSHWEDYDPDDYDQHDHPRILAVEYKAPEFWFVNGNDTLSGDISSDFVEVIGNIYENSDLTKGKEN